MKEYDITLALKEALEALRGELASQGVDVAACWISLFVIESDRGVSHASGARGDLALIGELAGDWPFMLTRELLQEGGPVEIREAQDDYAENLN